MAAKVLENCFVEPNPNKEGEEQSLTLPLLHFDLTWLYFHPVQRLLFFDRPFSEQQFQETIVPRLKISLSKALAYFPPLAGNIVHPINDDRKPFTRFSPGGDSVSLTVARSDKDFELLTGNGPRVADDFYDCVPHLPPPKVTADGGEEEIPVLALQATLFPDKGLCLGFTNHHAIGDASSIVGFIKTWACLNSEEDDALKVEKLLPFFDRSSVEDPNGLDSIYWNLMKKDRAVVSEPVKFPTNKLRATFVLTSEDVQKLKNSFMEKRPGVKHVTSFTVACGLAWSCLVKAEAQVGSTFVADDEPEFFAFAADCRARLNPPLPASYFGNCIAFVKAEAKHGELRGEDGFAYAAESTGDAVRRTAYNEKGILDGAESWPSEFGKLIGKRLFGVAGSPRFDLYDVDFGFGRAKKYESASIDWDTSMSLCKSRDFEGGLEIGLSREETSLSAFSALFNEALRSL